MEAKKRRLLVIVLTSVMLLAPVRALAGEIEWSEMRDQMIKEIEQDMYRARHYVGKASLSNEVIAAIRRVERHKFVSEEQQENAYRNHPLPIGNGQTISQPFIVALMTDLLEVGNNAKVLEIGTGSGYQAAVLAELVDEVFTVEIVGDLARRAQTLLATLGYDNVHFLHGDGMLGWPMEAPFDGIIVTAAGLDIPETLLNQLVIGGRLVMPVGGQGEVQQLKVITRNRDMSINQKDVLPVRFVPITKDMR
jgi:protein-L-isoaspartate(D-aspartate) O-methyltransferase